MALPHGDYAANKKPTENYVGRLLHLLAPTLGVHVSEKFPNGWRSTHPMYSINAAWHYLTTLYFEKFAIEVATLEPVFLLRLSDCYYQSYHKH